MLAAGRDPLDLTPIVYKQILKNLIVLKGGVTITDLWGTNCRMIGDF